MSATFYCILLCASFAAVFCAVQEDLVTNLPGYGPPPTKQYSGYLQPQGSTSKYLHYWLVESENDPAKDPLVVWLNGGPGCSSLDGYFAELGPLLFDDGTPDIPTLKKNPYAWNNIANVMFLEMPVAVGFSYTTDPSGMTYNDDTVAQDNFNFLVSFFKAYPEYVGRDFYISGESYAGVYIPTLAKLIVEANNPFNLKGLLVGNGCTGTRPESICHSEPIEPGLKVSIDFYNAHALMPMVLYDEILTSCKDFSPDVSNECIDLLNNSTTAMGDFDIHDVYAECIPKPTTELNDAILDLPTGRLRRIPRGDLLEQHRSALLRDSYNPPASNCIDPLQISFDKYLNNKEVQEAIHMTSSYVSGWKVCNPDLNPMPHGIYNLSTYSVIPMYQDMLIPQLRVLIYSGDVDACVPYTDSEAWTVGMGYEVKEDGAWRPWRVDEQVAGYVTQYSANDFTFLTVKGAGHMVPQYKPLLAFEMFKRYLSGGNY